MLFGIEAHWPPVRAAFCCLCLGEETSAGSSMQCLGGRWVVGVKMWAGRQVGVGPGGQVVGWTMSLWAVGSRMWVTWLSCQNIDARYDLQCGSLSRTLAGSSDLTQEQNQAINDLAL